MCNCASCAPKPIIIVNILVIYLPCRTHTLHWAAEWKMRTCRLVLLCSSIYVLPMGAYTAFIVQSHTHTSWTSISLLHALKVIFCSQSSLSIRLNLKEKKAIANGQKVLFSNWYASMGKRAGVRETAAARMGFINHARKSRFVRNGSHISLQHTQYCFSSTAGRAPYYDLNSYALLRLCLPDAPFDCAHTLTPSTKESRIIRNYKRHYGSISLAIDFFPFETHLW